MPLRGGFRSCQEYTVSLYSGLFVCWAGRYIPSIVSLHPSQAAQMSQHASNHTGHAGHTLEEDKPSQPLLLCHSEFGWHLLARLWMSVSRHKVHAPSEDAHSAESNPVRPVGGFAVGNLYLSHLRLGVSALCVSYLS